MDRSSRVFVAGHRGLVGSALVRRLCSDGYSNLITKSRADLDLTDQRRVDALFRDERPEYVFLAAGRVGGINANNTYPAEFIHTNLAIQTSVIHASYQAGIRRLVYFGSGCAYPKECPQPMREEYLHTGRLEPTNEPFAVAKLAGIAMCHAYNRQYGTVFLSVIPATLYGPGDDFDLETSHVLSALLRKTHEAKQGSGGPVGVWGTGSPRREFLYVDDLADASVLLMKQDAGTISHAVDGSGSVMNVGSGRDIGVLELARLIAGIVGHGQEPVPDPTRPDGIPRRLLDTSRMSRLGWKPRVSLEDGIRATYNWYREAGSVVAD